MSEIVPVYVDGEVVYSKGEPVAFTLSLPKLQQILARDETASSHNHDCVPDWILRGPPCNNPACCKPTITPDKSENTLGRHLAIFIYCILAILAVAIVW